MGHVVGELLLTDALWYGGLTCHHVGDRPPSPQLLLGCLQVGVSLLVVGALFGSWGIADQKRRRGVSAQPAEAATVQIESDKLAASDGAFGGPAPPRIHVFC